MPDIAVDGRQANNAGTAGGGEGATAVNPYTTDCYADSSPTGSMCPDTGPPNFDGARGTPAENQRSRERQELSRITRLLAVDTVERALGRNGTDCVDGPSVRDRKYVDAMRRTTGRMLEKYRPLFSRIFSSLATVEGSYSDTTTSTGGRTEGVSDTTARTGGLTEGVSDTTDRTGGQTEADGEYVRSPELLKAVADKLFADKRLNWGRLVALYAFAARWAQHLRSSTAESYHASGGQHIALLLADYVDGNLSNWMLENGGWDRFVEKFPPSFRGDDLEEMVKFALAGLLALAGIAYGVRKLQLFAFR